MRVMQVASDSIRSTCAYHRRRGAFSIAVAAHDSLEAVCPQKWMRVDSSLKCAPPAEYHGPCRHFTIHNNTGRSRVLSVIGAGGYGISKVLLTRCTNGGQRNAAHFGHARIETRLFVDAGLEMGCAAA